MTLFLFYTQHSQGSTMKLSKYLILGTLSSYALTGCIGSDSSSSTVVGADTYIPLSETGGLLWGTHESLLKTDGTQAGTQLVYDPAAANDQSVHITELTSLGDFVYFKESIQDEDYSLLPPAPSRAYNQLDTNSNTIAIQSTFSNNDWFDHFSTLHINSKIYTYRIKTMTVLNVNHFETDIVEYNNLGVVTDHTSIMSGHKLSIVTAPIVVGTKIYFGADGSSSAFIEFDTVNLTATALSIPNNEFALSFSAVSNTLYVSSDQSNLYSYDTTSGTLNTTAVQTGIVMSQNELGNIPENNGFLFSSDQSNILAFDTSNNTTTTLDACINSNFLYNNSTEIYLVCHTPPVPAAPPIAAIPSQKKILKVDTSTSALTSTLYTNAQIVDIHNYAIANGGLFFAGQDANYSANKLWFMGFGASAPVEIAFGNIADDIGTPTHLTELNGDIIFSARNQTTLDYHLYHYDTTTTNLSELY